MTNKIYIGNLAYSVTDDALKNIFEQFGEVRSSVVVKDKATGKSRGFGFIEMASEEEAAIAIEKLNKTPAEGRTMFVSEAKSSGPFTKDNNFSRRGFGKGTTKRSNRNWRQEGKEDGGER